ncbi:MAG: hypothetical protein ACXWAT_09520 [Methylobacter sp.]
MPNFAAVQNPRAITMRGPHINHAFTYQFAEAVALGINGSLSSKAARAPALLLSNRTYFAFIVKSLASESVYFQKSGI